MAHLYLAATQKSSGKTTLSIGLATELCRRGRRVQPFKKGPDYIDPLWLSRAAGRACFNLDYHTMSADEIRGGFTQRMAGVDIGLIEGNVGLFDSVDLAGAHSNAELAKLLEAPLMLIVDVQGMARGLAPLLLGYQAFDPALTIAGVLLNKVGGGRHETNLRRVVEHYTDVPVVGCIPRLPELRIVERHLGLMPSNEADGAEQTIERIRTVVAAHCDVDRIEAIAETAPLLAEQTAEQPSTDVVDGPKVRIAIAEDDAFGFYYPDDLAALERAGAELIAFSPVRDADLPAADALLLGGGFPECRMRELEANAGMRAAIADFINAGGPAYAECGGLMYLTDRLHWDGRASRMCGVLRADVTMHPRPQGRGYVRLRETPAFPWSEGPDPHAEICAHEFHHSAIMQPDASWTYGYQVLRGTGIDGRHDGIVYRNLLASYAHLRNVGGVAWTRRFVDRIRSLI